MLTVDAIREIPNGSTSVERNRRNSWIELARFFLNQQDLTSAEAACQQGIRMGNRAALTLLCREIYWNRMRSPERVIARLEEEQPRSLREDPLLLSLLGLAYLREGMLQKAETLFHQIYCVTDMDLRRRLLDDLRPFRGYATPEGEAAARILTWFDLPCEQYRKNRSAVDSTAEILHVSDPQSLCLQAVVDRLASEQQSQIRFVDISGTQIRDLTPLAALTNLEELHCYALTEPLGLLALVKMPQLKRIAEHRSLNEWERYRFKKLRSDVVFI